MTTDLVLPISGLMRTPLLSSHCVLGGLEGYCQVSESPISFSFDSDFDLIISAQGDMPFINSGPCACCKASLFLPIQQQRIHVAKHTVFYFLSTWF